MPTPALEVRDLFFRHHQGAESPGSAPPTISVRHLALERGQQLLLSGPSGCGKSTLLHLIAGLMEPQSGSVVVQGQNIHSLKGAARDRFRGRSIGMIFQTFNLLHGFSALENVCAALMFSSIPQMKHEPVARALLEHLGIARPDAEADRQSIGQQQRIAVARAIACEPVLVLADEPTASLDPENSRKAIALIQSACREKGAALLCVSHDPQIAHAFDARLTFDELGPSV